MSTLLTAAQIIALTDQTSLISSVLLTAIDTAVVNAETLANTTLPGCMSTDYGQLSSLYPFCNGIIQPPTSGSLFGGGGFIGGSLGTGAGLLGRKPILLDTLNPWITGLTASLQQYGGGVGVTNLPTAAQYYNGITPFSLLFCPAFASLYQYCTGQYLAAASVFAPQGILLCHGVITNITTVTLSNAYCTNFPVVNGYSVPAPTTDQNGNPLYVGSMPIAQGFAPLKNSEVVISTTVVGTCLLTVTGPNQAGLQRYWTAILDSATASTILPLTPTIGGDRLSGVPTDLSVVGTASVGAFDIVSGATER